MEDLTASTPYTLVMQEEIYNEIIAVTRRMLTAMHERDVKAYKACCADDLSAFEWYIARTASTASTST